MKKIIITSAIVTLCLTALAQEDKKVAIFDPVGSVPKSSIDMVREEISSVVVKSAGYKVLERSLINKVLEENKFQMSGLVDDSQISELGKIMGANYALITSLTLMDNGNYYISCKMIDVITARIEKQETARTQSGTNDLIDIAENMAKKMFGTGIKMSEVNISSNKGLTNSAEGKDITTTQQTNRPTVDEKVPLQTLNTLSADGRKVYQGGRQLSQYEVRKIMVNHTEALKLYNKGVSKNKNGNIWIWSGVGLYAVGIVFMAAATPYEYYYDGYNQYTSGNDYGTLGSLCFAAGSGAFIAGIILKTTSKKPVKESVDMYNRGLSKGTGMELKIGIVGNGVGLAVVF